MYDGTNQILYVNGAPDTASQPIGSKTLYTNLGPVRIGIVNEGSFNYPFNGLIDEVQIYNRGLSATEILAIYNAGGAGTCKGYTFSGFFPPVSNPTEIGRAHV